MFYGLVRFDFYAAQSLGGFERARGDGPIAQFCLLAWLAFNLIAKLILVYFTEVPRSGQLSQPIISAHLRDRNGWEHKQKRYPAG